MEMLYSFLHITKAHTKAHFSRGNSGCWRQCGSITGIYFVTVQL